MPDSAPPHPSARDHHQRPIGLIRLGAWLLISGIGIVLWLQYPGGYSEFGAPLLGGSGVLLAPSGSWRRSVSPRVARLFISAILLFLVLFIAAFSFGWPSLRHGHPHLLLAVKTAGAFLWLAAAIQVSRLLSSGPPNLGAG